MDTKALPSAIPLAHLSSPDETAERLQVRPEVGLGLEEVEQRRQLYGMNRLPEAPPRSALVGFYLQFIFIAILFGADSIVANIGALEDAAVILTVAVINAFVGFFQEYHAERSLLESAN